MTLTLKTSPREKTTSLESVRSEGNIPAVMYGAGKESKSISITEADFIKVFREAGESTMISLEGAGNNGEALIQDVQQDPVSGKVLHVDFKLIEAGKPIVVTVPLEFVGDSPAVKTNLGTLTKVLHEIEIEVLPKDLPHSIQVDLSSLAALDDQILINDLVLPNGVSVENDPEEVIAVISAAHEEPEEPVDTEVDFSQIEVEKKGKKETDGEGESNESANE